MKNETGFVVAFIKVWNFGGNDPVPLLKQDLVLKNFWTKCVITNNRYNFICMTLNEQFKRVPGWVINIKCFIGTRSTHVELWLEALWCHKSTQLSIIIDARVFTWG